MLSPAIRRQGPEAHLPTPLIFGALPALRPQWSIRPQVAPLAHGGQVSGGVVALVQVAMVDGQHDAPAHPPPRLTVPLHASPPSVKPAATDATRNRRVWPKCELNLKMATSPKALSK